MQAHWQDLRYGAQMLLKNPGCALIAVLMLVLNIRAHTAKVSVLASVPTIQSQAFNHPTAAIAQEPLHGDWVGGVQLGSNWIFIQAHFKTQGNGLTGTLDIPRHNAVGLPLSR